MIRNRQKTIYAVSSILTLFFLAVILTSIILPESMGDMAPPILFLSIFLGITCLVVALMFRKRSKLIEQAIEKGDFIARWQFSPSEWNQYIEYEYAERKAQRKAAFIFLSIIIIIIFTIFIFVIDEAKLAMFLTMVGLEGFLALFAFIIPFLLKKGSKPEEAEILIMKESVLLNRQFHSWHAFSSALLSARIKEKPFRHLELVYSYVTRFGKQSYKLFVPVPETADAEEVIKILKKENELR